MGKSYSVEYFIDGLRSEDESMRRWAAEWLADYGSDTRAIEPLATLIGDSTQLHQIRYYAVRALGRINDPRAFALLLDLLHDESGSLQSVATSTLGRSGNKQAFDPLVHYLNHPDSAIRAGAATGLGWLGDRRAVELLLPKLNDADEYVQICAITALGKLGDLMALPSLLEVLRHPDDYYRELAVRALMLIGSPAALPALRDVEATDSSKTVRKAAAKAIKHIESGGPGLGSSGGDIAQVDNYLI